MATTLDDGTIEDGRGRFTDRQAAVLQCALTLLVEGGEKSVTTAGVAAAANCSKESIYRWFGDRDGLLSAMVTYQASKVRIFEPQTLERLDAAALRGHLVTFAADLLTVLAGETSLALNRLGMGAASKARQNGARTLGTIVLERGRQRIGQRAGVLLDAARAAGALVFDDREDAFRTLYGLIVRDTHLRMLLGETELAQSIDFRGEAERAIADFYRLYGAEQTTP